MMGDFETPVNHRCSTETLYYFKDMVCKAAVFVDHYGQKASSLFAGMAAAKRLLAARKRRTI